MAISSARPEGGRLALPKGSERLRRRSAIRFRVAEIATTSIVSQVFMKFVLPDGSSWQADNNAPALELIQYRLLLQPPIAAFIHAPHVDSCIFRRKDVAASRRVERWIGLTR